MSDRQASRSYGTGEQAKWGWGSTGQRTMAASIAELDALLNDLEARLPQMIEDYPNDTDFWAAFAADAEAIEDKADEHAYEHVMQRINAMLAEHGRYIAGIKLEVEA